MSAILGGGQPAPLPTPVAPVAPPPPASPVDPEIGKARARKKQQASLAAGRDSTILTSGQGLTDAATSTKKTALGA
jgi:hypothetical protein